MPSSRKKGARRRRGNNRRASGRWTEYIPFSTPNGTTLTITTNYLSERPPRANFRPVRATVECVGLYCPARTADPSHAIGYWAPAAVQFWFSQAATSHSVTSPVFLVSQVPRSHTIVYNGTEDWYAYDVPASTDVLRLQVVCLGQPGSNGDQGYVRGVIRIELVTQPEILTATCPSLLATPDSDDEDDVSVI